MWGYMNVRDRVFNVGAIGLIFGIAGLNYLYGYRIYMGQQMELIELRPSYSERFRVSYRLMKMSPEEKQAFLEEQLRHEEEKAEVK